MVRYNRELTEEVKDLARRLGAEMVGVGLPERWREAPLMLSPLGLLPTARSVIVCGICFLDASMELTNYEISEHWYNPYDRCEALTGMNERLNSIAFNLARLLESRGYRSVPTPVSNQWRIRPYKDINHPFAPALANRYAAVACGLGEIGWNGLFLSPKYGPRQRLIPVVTEAPLEPTPMYEGPALCDRCMICVRRCPLDCFRKEVRKVNKLDIGGRVFEFPDINKWRCYLDYYGIYGPFLPEEITEDIAVRIAHSDRKPKRSIMDSGACLCNCVPPHLRYTDTKYPMAIRRKRERREVDPKEATEELVRMALEKGIDYMGIASRGEFLEKGIDLQEYLPDGTSGVVFGFEHSSESMKHATSLRLREVLFDLSHFLQENTGYSTLPVPRISAESMARFFGFKEEGAQYLHIITELPLKSLRVAPIAGRAEKSKISAKEIKSFTLGKGADLVGISSVERLNKVYLSLKSIYKEEQTIDKEVEHMVGAVTSVFKSASIEKVQMKRPEDYLPGAKSVIVVGLHYPYTVIETVAKPPAEQIASYACFTSYGVLDELFPLALDIVKFLQKAGYNAELTSDLFGLSGKTKHWWDNLDSTSNNFAAICAGLGEIGWRGQVLTPQYGFTQKFICIVTDAELEEDSLYKGAPLCKRCYKCVDACPVGALSREDKVTLEIEDRVFEFGKVDRLRCEWASYLGLVGDEGPKYLGCSTDIVPPKEITSESVSNALKQLNPIELSWYTVFERCLCSCEAFKSSSSYRRRDRDGED